MKQVTDQESDSVELKPSEKARLALLMLQVGLDNHCHTPGSLLRSYLHHLNQELKSDKRKARSQHWKANSDRALQAANRYIQAQNTSTPVSLADVAREFGTSERSVSRYITKLKTGEAL